MPRAKQAAPITTAQQLASTIKSARDIMRKDKGLSTDLDRLPLLTWVRVSDHVPIGSALPGFTPRR